MDMDTSVVGIRYLTGYTTSALKNSFRLPMDKVTIYSTSTCHFCQAAKAFFAENNVAYEDFNVGEDAAKRQEMVEMTGQLGVPVIRIGDDVIVGFDEGKVRELLKI